MPPPPGITPPASDIVTLSLISHTNAGKTTLARTLLRRDVGEVRDAAHVTLQNESFTLLEQEARRLQLWDTPGFGDSARLLKRLRRERNPVLWFLSQTWDRLTDRPLWCSQQALRNVRDEADVVLYLVNATEPPEIAAYIRPEMEVLAWVGKPVLVLLNQTGPAREPAEEAAETASWRHWFREFDQVREVLNLDAFARCWVQEDHLMEALMPLLPETKQEAFKHLKKAWRACKPSSNRRACSPNCSPPPCSTVPRSATKPCWNASALAAPSSTRPTKPLANNSPCASPTASSAPPTT